MTGEFVHFTDEAAARAQLEQDGHLGLTGLIRPALLAPALEDARGLVPRKSRGRALGEQVSKLNTMPDPQSQPDLFAVLEAVRIAAQLAGRDITPSMDAEKPQVEILDMLPGTRGNRHQDDPSLTDVVAITNLLGESTLWFEKGDVTYTINPCDIVIHDLERRLIHRGAAIGEGPRAGLAVAKRCIDPI